MSLLIREPPNGIRYLKEQQCKTLTLSVDYFATTMINMTRQDKEPNLNNFEIPGFSSKAKREKNFSNNSAFSLIFLNTFLRLTYSQRFENGRILPEKGLNTLRCTSEENFNRLEDSYGFKF